MFILSGRLGFALVLAALCLGVRTAHAQAAPLSYWIPDSPFGLGSFSASQGPVTYGNFPSFDGRAADSGGFSYARYNFGNGWFVGSERASLGLSGISQDAAFDNFGSIHVEGTQFGYNFQNSPVTLFGGVDTLKYNSGIGNPFAPFDSNSGALNGYSAHAGVEIRPTSNLSLQFGASYTEQPSDINSLMLPGASPVGIRH
ncbi:MAG TPA: hypothetical protein VKR55_18380 [Bradyrhizobium sp.]|uniref:outer membrane protein n=1 Tax=Bradyrhizobium sp. TaxID=376 RepID=UPI002C62AC7B|nr:hypothetical protein [Bradyrhizobium sp.]HLZ04099.1 hypothetical protein [Bradyrhizobium sp.]